jgi:hypothetical protein
MQNDKKKSTTHSSGRCDLIGELMRLHIQLPSLSVISSLCVMLHTGWLLCQSPVSLMILLSQDLDSLEACSAHAQMQKQEDHLCTAIRGQEVCCVDVCLRSWEPVTFVKPHPI